MNLELGVPFVAFGRHDFEMIVRVIQGIVSRLRAVYLRVRGAHIEGSVWLRRIDVPRHAERIALGVGAALDRNVTLIVSGDDPHESPAIRIGRRVYINRQTIIDASTSIEIGDDCMIGPFCYITDHDHVTGKDGRPATGGLLSKPVIIHANAWIGAHVTILKGVTVGSGAIIGAGSVVTKDVAPNTTVVGNPARVLDRRSCAP